MDDILSQIKSSESEEGECCQEIMADLSEIELDLDVIESKVDDCCSETHSMLEEIMLKIGLPVGGSVLPFEKIPEAVEFISDNLPAMTLIAVFSLLAMWITRNNA
jgi:hypothetical protein